jgi:outer membrane lipoprotein carrier protein
MTTGQGHKPHHTSFMTNIFSRHLLQLVLASSVAIISVAGHAQEQGATGQNAPQNGLQNLENFVKHTKSGRAVFTQVVTSPAKEGQVAKSKTSSGTFEFLRPNRFKFVYKKPFEQTIVSDGQTLWLYDADLNQTTSRKLAQVLNGTPAAVIAAAADLKGLQADFNLTALPEKSGLQWVQATPKAKDGQLQNISVGFKVTDKGSELAALEIFDSFGQRSVMTFSQFEVNPTLAPASFQFKPPAGSDVIRQ